MKSAVWVLAFLVCFVAPALPQKAIDVGTTGWDVKTPAMASACEPGCPWGELGDFVREVWPSRPGVSVLINL
jgi:hypothetical protein